MQGMSGNMFERMGIILDPCAHFEKIMEELFYFEHNISELAKDKGMSELAYSHNPLRVVPRGLFTATLMRIPPISFFEAKE